jgi:hypothetical protein
MKNTKTFITVIAEQAVGNLKKSVYKAPESKELFYEKGSSFPIINVINAYAEPEDEIKIIAIMNKERDSAKYNFEEIFKSELMEVKQEKGLKNLDIENIHIIDAISDQTMESNLNLFEDILEALDDNETLYACITYGTKPMPMMLFMALNYAYKVKMNIEIGAIVYGAFYSGEGAPGAAIYDLTSLFYTNALFLELANAGESDPVGKLKEIRKTFFE